MSNTTISVKEKVLEDLKDLVEPRREDESWSDRLDRIYIEFSLMQNCLKQHNLLDELHPEWKYKGE